MKIFASTLVALLGLTGLSYAGPEPVAASEKEMKSVMPVATPCPSWTGFYVGGLAGYTHGEMNTDITSNGVQYNIEPGFAATVHDHSPDLSTDGAELGGLLGYNFQWHNLVFGAEAAGGYLWLRDSNSTTFPSQALDFPDIDVRLSTSLKTHYLFTFGGKLGYALCRWLPYVTGGLAAGDLDFDQQLLLQDDGGFRHAGSISETNIGWFLGGGLEYKLTNHWRLRAQYQYVDLGDVSFTREDSLGFDHFTGQSASLREHNAQLALIFGF